MFISLRNEKSIESRKLIDAVSVERRPQVQQLLKDRTESRKYEHPRYQGTYKVEFPEVCCRVVEDVTLSREYVALHKSGVIVDHLTTYRGYADGTFQLDQARADLLVGFHKEVQAHSGEPEGVEEVTLVAHNEGGGTWGHWIVQNLPKILLFRQIYPEGKIALPPAYTALSNNFGASLRHFGIEASNIMTIDRNRSYRFKRAAFVDHVYHAGAAHPVVFDLLNRSNGATNDELLPPRVLMDRATSEPTREIANLNDLAQLAKKRGFGRARIGALPFERQLDTWRSGTHFLGVLGSDFTNIVFAEPGSHILSITPDFHHDNFFYDLAAAKGLIWSEILCGRIVVERQPRRSSSFEVDAGVFSQLLEGATR